ncbi:hypothetical protein [Paraclostridium sordellii]|uniref:hypothetical protein n=1 Tax=Paraclostridium sordellii TaxID=1505 RepID=UPI0005DB0570|nr:hypothetical protein [Paeniclostridium sordellii]CEQ17625.1 Uncharacterised protein [[Clostridium] sordellii] [Paeniclostridium sordellii]
MKLKRILIHNIIYIVVIAILYVVINHFGFKAEFIKYIKFETVNLKFQDLLSIFITVLSIFEGAIITVATVLISMCDKRILRLINKYGESRYLVEVIKTSIISGISVIFLLAIIYAKLDFNIMQIRWILLYLAGILLCNFVVKSSILIRLVLSILNDAFENDDTLVIEPEFKEPK